MTTKVTLQAESYKVKESNSTDGFKIEGLALPFGAKSRNGVIYNKESAIRAASSMIGAPSLFNHDENMVIGNVTKFEPGEVDGTEGMVYEININPNAELPSRVKVAEALERGDISKVSIQAFVDEEEFDGDEVFVESFVELSPVSIPGFPQTTARVASSSQVGVGVPVEEFVEGVKKNKVRKGDTKMVKEEEDKVKQEDEVVVEGEDEEQQEEVVSKEQDEEVMEMLESLTERLDALASRVEAVEDLVEAGDEATDDDEDDDEDEDEEESTEGEADETEDGEDEVEGESASKQPAPTNKGESTNTRTALIKAWKKGKN